MKLIWFLLPFCFLMQFSFSQTATIRGTIEDARNGEQLPFANVFETISGKGTTSNYYGFYSITLPKGPVKLQFIFLGYETRQMDFYLEKDTLINLRLNISSQELEEVVIRYEKPNSARSSQMSLVEIPIQTIKQLPVLLGETDLMKTIQLLPGVKSGTEGSSGIYVRGGGPDQNLILLDGVPVYNVNHLFGIFSVFNSDAVQSFSLLKGGFPARYGGRLSSVIDIKMKEGNNQKFQGEASLGLISSKIMLEGPIVKDKTSFIISARRSYFDVLTWPIQWSQNDGEGLGGYYFYDANAKINHKFSDKSRLFLSFYSGLDKAYFKESYTYTTDEGKFKEKNQFGLGWGNITTALRWNYILRPSLFLNTTATYSQYKFFVSTEMIEENFRKGVKDVNAFRYSSGINDLALKIAFDYIPSPTHYVRFGMNHTYHTFNPGINVFKIDLDQSLNIDTTFGNKAIPALESYLYIEDDIEITDRWKTNIGVNVTSFFVREKSYFSMQPRISSRYLLTPDLSLKASYVRMNQYIHLLTNSNIGMPTDLWVPVTDIVKPQIANQYALGLSYDINETYDISIEGYYKDMYNLIEYKEGASFLSISQTGGWETKIEHGKGWSKGIEVLFNKNLGKLTGWVGYTLSKTDRQFQNISEGKVFPFKFDRRHDFAVAGAYRFNDRFDISGSWVYATGNAVTLPEQKYPGISGMNYLPDSWQNIEYFEYRNSYRMPPTHRLDLGMNLNKKKKHGTATWSWGAYNVYNRQNPYLLMFTLDKEGNTVLMQYSILPIIPYIKYSFRF